MFVGPLSSEEQVLHDCDTKPCVRPDHLFSGSQLDNMHDMIAKGRQARGSALNHRPQNGSRNYNACLREEQVQQIKLKLQLGEQTQRAIAAEYGVHYATISAIAVGKSWIDV